MTACSTRWQLYRAYTSLVTSRSLMGEWRELPPDEREKLEAEREKPEYQEALQAYRAHLATCPVCKQGK